MYDGIFICTNKNSNALKKELLSCYMQMSKAKAQ